MLSKIKYYLLAFSAGVGAVSFWLIGRKKVKLEDTEILSKQIDEKKERLKLLENTEVSVDNLSADEVIEYWKNKP